MIVIKVEIWPYGNEDKAKKLCRANIINEGTGSETLDDTY